MNHFEDLVFEITPKVKELGYKKNRFTWYKIREGLTVVFSLQKSQFDSNCWYYNYGICLHDIAEGNVHTISACQIKYRLDNIVNGVLLSPDDILNLLKKWDLMYGDIKLLKLSAVQGKLPIQSTQKAIGYLTTVNISKL